MSVSDRVRFFVDKVALGQVSLRVLQFTPVNIISPCFSIPYIIWWMDNRPVVGRSSEISSPHQRKQQHYLDICKLSSMGITGLENWSYITHTDWLQTLKCRFTVYFYYLIVFVVSNCGHNS
jgi:hypothetical protein